MNIVLLNQYYPPAEAPTGLLLADLSERLAAEGHGVTVICSRRDYADPARTFARRERANGVEVRRAWITGYGRGTRLGRLLDYGTFLAGAAHRLLAGPRPDVVVALTTPPMLASVVLPIARRRRARMLYWVMDLYPDLAFALGALSGRAPAGRLLRALSLRTLRAADRVVALGETMAARVRRQGARRVEVIHNWVDGSRIRPQSTDSNPVRGAWGWSDRFVALYSGNLGLAYEFDTILGAAERLSDNPDVRIAFVGGGPARPAIEAEARRRRLANVEFRPSIERGRLSEGLAAGDLHLVTLRPKMPGLLVPSKIYGILAAGRPAAYVGPPEGEVAEILAAGRCGTRVEPGDADGLARVVRAYAADPERRAEEGARARRLFEERYDRPIALARFLRVFEELS